MTTNVEFWWTSLRVIATFNIAVWCWSALVIMRRRRELTPKVYLIRRMQLLLSGIYVFGCAFRSFFPVYDIPRLTLSECWVANALVGRTVATFAELCFAAQWVLVMREIHERTGARVAGMASRCVLPMIMAAEIFSWYSVLTTANIGHVLEESLWGLAAVMLVAGLLSSRSWLVVRWRTACYAVAIVTGAYGLYIFAVDVPMYWTRWLLQQAQHQQYLNISQGVADAAQRHVVSHHWHDWESEVMWMSVYFSVAVWLSIAMIHVPAPAVAFIKKQRSRLRRDVRT